MSLSSDYRHFKLLASRPGPTRPFVASKLQSLGVELKMDQVDIDADILGPESGVPADGLHNLTDHESKGIAKKFKLDIHAGFTFGPKGFPIEVGPYINVRIRREVHRIVMKSCANAGMSLSRYLAFREGLLDADENEE